MKMQRWRRSWSIDSKECQSFAAFRILETAEYLEVRAAVFANDSKTVCPRLGIGCATQAENLTSGNSAIHKVAIFNCSTSKREGLSQGYATVFVFREFNMEVYIVLAKMDILVTPLIVRIGKVNSS